MEENKNPLESELAEALADVVMDEDNDDKHETFIKRFDTPDEIVQYWEHQLEKVKSCQKFTDFFHILKFFFLLGYFDIVSFSRTLENDGAQVFKSNSKHGITQSLVSH